MELVKMNRNKKIKISFICLILSILFSAGTFVCISNMPSKVVTLTVAANGGKNADSDGNYVEITGLTEYRETGDQYQHSLSEAKLSGNWSFDESANSLVCQDPDDDSEAMMKIYNAEKIKVDFKAGGNGGKANVYIDDELKETVDSYSLTDGKILSSEYELSYPQITLCKILMYVLGVLSFIFFMAFAVLIYKPFKEFVYKYTPIKLYRLKNAVLMAFFAVVLVVLVSITFQSQIYRNVYLDEAELTITATSEKNEDALANNVRIRNILVNGRNYDFTKIDTSDGWTYNGADNLIYVYNAEKPCSIKLPVKNVRTLEVVYVKEVGSGIIELAMDGKKFAKVDAYSDCSWDMDSVKYKASPLIEPYSSYSAMAVIFVLFAILGYILNKNGRFSKIFNYIKFIDANIVLSIILYLALSVMQRESLFETFNWIGDYTSSFAEGLLIVVLLNIILVSIVKKNYRSFLILSIVGIILLTANYFKLEFRDVPLLPWDFMLISVAGSVVSRFKLVPSLSYLIAVVVFVAIMVIIRFAVKKIKTDDLKLLTRISTLVVSIIILVVFAYSSLFNTTVNLFAIKDYYDENGFVLAFAENMQYINPITEPEGYSEAKMNEIAEKIEQAALQKNSAKPNIIVLMSESFWDITRVKALNFNEEMFPTYDKLKQTSITGELLTNVYNGGTVNSEFEAITGFSVAYLPSEYMPYQRSMRPDFYSINSFLKSEGYDSLAIHPYEKTNYNRNTAYEYLNFDKTLWEEDFDEDADRMRGYISDKALTQKIIAEYENHKSNSDSPWFNLSISMQNHGGYWESYVDQSKKVDVDTSNFSSTYRGSIEDLATGLHYSDLALGELIDYFKEVNDPTIIVMFGDHMSDAGGIVETLLDKSSSDEDQENLTRLGRVGADSSAYNTYEQKRVPFMAWSNFEEINKKFGTLSVTQLLPTVLSEYKTVMPEYFYYLKNAQRIYPACASGIFVNNDGTCDFIENMTDEQKAQYEENWLIEYDYIFGENYLSDIFDYLSEDD